MKNKNEKLFNGYYTYSRTTPGCDTLFERYNSYVKNGNFLNLEKLPFIKDFANYAYSNLNTTNKNFCLVKKNKNYKVMEVPEGPSCLQWRSKYIFDFDFRLMPYKYLLTMTPKDIVKEITKNLGLKKAPTIFLKPELCGFGVVLRITKPL